MAFLADVHLVQLDLPAAVRARHGGNAAARVNFYEPKFHTLNVWVSISAFVLGFSMLIFLFNVVYSLIFVREKAARTRGTPSRSSGRFRHPFPSTTSSRYPVFDSDPYDYGTPPLTVGGPSAAGAGG